MYLGTAVPDRTGKLIKGPMMTKTLTQAEKTEIIQTNGGKQENILNILLALQNACDEGYVDKPTLSLVADELSMTETRVFEIATFYSMIKTRPQARHVFQICGSTPCHFSHAKQIAEWLEAELAVPAGQITPDGMFSYEWTSCVGVCELGPVVKVRDVTFGDLTKEKIQKLIHDFRTMK